MSIAYIPQFQWLKHNAFNEKYVREMCRIKMEKKMRMNGNLTD